MFSVFEAPPSRPSENGLERGFAGKHRPNCLLITDPKNIETNDCSTIQNWGLF